MLEKTDRTVANLPFVSIVITSYNYEDYISSCIESALSQDYAYIEIIIVDDGSQDSSPEIIKAYQDRATVILSDNSGQGAALNQGIAKSKGDIICLLDSDDAFEPAKVSKVVDSFLKYREISWCFHPLRYVNCDNELIAIYPPPPYTEERILDFRQRIQKKPKKPPWGSPTSGLCFSRSFLKEEILPIPKMMTQSPDSYLRNLALLRGKGLFLNEPLSLMRIHGKNARYMTATPKIKFSEAYWTRLKAPELSGLTNKVFSWGLSRYWACEKDIQSETLIQEYRQMATFSEWAAINLRAAYHFTLDKIRVIRG